MALGFRRSWDSRMDLHFLLVSTGQTIRLQISGNPISGVHYSSYEFWPELILGKFSKSNCWWRHWPPAGRVATFHLSPSDQRSYFLRIKRSSVILFRKWNLSPVFFSFRSSRHWWTFTSFSHVIAILSAENSEMVKLYRYICIFFLSFVTRRPWHSKRPERLDSHLPSGTRRGRRVCFLGFILCLDLKQRHSLMLTNTFRWIGHFCFATSH